MNITAIKKPSAATLLETYLNLAFYLCVCPFRSKLANNTTDSPSRRKWQYVTYSNWLQKSFCFLFSTTAFIWIIRRNYDEMPSVRNGTGPDAYFQIIWGVVDLLQKCVTIKIFWFDRQNISAILNFLLNKETKGLGLNQLVTSRLAAFCLFLPYLAISLVGFIAGRGLAVPQGISNWYPTFWWQSVQCTSRSIFLFETSSQENSNCTHQASMLNVGLGILGVIGLFQR